MVDRNHGCPVRLSRRIFLRVIPRRSGRIAEPAKFSAFRLGNLGINIDPIHPVVLSDPQEKQIPLVDKPFTDNYHNMYKEGGKMSPIQNKLILKKIHLLESGALFEARIPQP